MLERGLIMALTLRQLCEQSWYQYEMNIVAGSKGADNVVQWIYALEDAHAGDFIRGGELIFTTGIGKNEGVADWLLSFVKTIYSHEASGLVVNIGPYIQTIPPEVVTYCDEHSFPLLEIPWKVHLVDVTRDFCNKIFESEKEAQTLSSIFETIIFHPGEAAEYLPELSRRGFHGEGDFCLIGIHALLDHTSLIPDQIFTERLVRLVSHMEKKAAHIFRGEYLFLILNDFMADDMDDLVNQVQTLGANVNCSVQIAVGPAHKKLFQLSVGFRKVEALLRVMLAKNQPLMYYDRLGVQKIILSVDDTQVLEEFVHDTLGSLIRYDRENGTDYMNLLKRYLDQNGSVQKVAEELYVHRNTVNYQLNKVKKILCMDMDTMEKRFQIMLAFQIREFLE